MNAMDRLDPELVEPLEGFMQATGGFSLRDIPATRAMADAMIAAVNAEAPAVPGIAVEDTAVPSAEAGVEVPVRIYRPDEPSPHAVLLWMHPGGFVIGSLEMEDIAVRQLAKAVGCAVVSINYRLAPEDPYPAAIEDCTGAFRWIADNASGLGFDASRIALGGPSAGGGLAAGTCLKLRDEGGAQPAFQLLVYPAIDDTNIEPASESVPDNLFWSRENSLIGWSAYLNGKQASDGVPPYAAPARARDLGGLPNTFIAAGTVDMLLNESIEYAERLTAAGVAADLAVYPGACHAFDVFAPTSRVAQAYVADRNRALKAAFG